MMSNTDQLITKIIEATNEGKLSWKEENDELYQARFPDERMVAILVRDWFIEPVERYSKNAMGELTGSFLSRMSRPTDRKPFLRLSVRNLEDGKGNWKSSCFH